MRQLGLAAAGKFLDHPQCFLGPTGIGGQNLAWAEALRLGGVAHAGGRIGGGVARQLEPIGMAAAQALAQVLAAGHQIGAIQTKASPVLQHPQALAGSIQVGIQQAIHRTFSCRLARCGIDSGDHEGVWGAA